jgi:two-component system sporulation sensor kinase A
VLLNLVKNGAEALEGAGRLGVSARLCSDPDRPQVRVRVTDTGCGIPEEQQGRLLEPFYSSKEGGTGLGLAIVDRILRLHGTQLEVNSVPEQGTSMEFVLPAVRDAEER